MLGRQDCFHFHRCLAVAVKTHALKFFAAIICMQLTPDSACAQRNLSSAPAPPTIRLAEISQLKRKAESGNLNAQLALGQSFASFDRPADALSWYRKAAAQGSADAAFLAGELLLHGRTAGDAAQQLPANPEAGIALIYCAATNRHAAACRAMSIARQRGVSTRTNIVEAYAWLRFYAEADPVRRKRELDALGLVMTVEQLDQADRLVSGFYRGNWPVLETTGNYRRDSRLKLSGVTVGGQFPLAIINRRTIAEGESAAIAIEGGTVNVKCLKISTDSVLVTVDQEPEPRLISFY